MTKSAEAFRTISEVSELLETPAHVLRFWESRFTQVKPVKRAGGRRYYRPGDVALLGGIKQLLHNDGLTIRGVQKILREQGVRHVADHSNVTVAEPLAEAEPEKPKGTGPRPTPAPPETVWPETPSPDTAPAAGTFVPDPGDTASEAPMDVDVPTLPAGGPDNVLPLTMPDTPASQTAAADTKAPEPAADAANPPAATLLRAMDTLRARDKKAELLSVYLRLSKLRDRISGSNIPRRG
ncbi:MAG: MerR family transcriptional regulator [Rhodobacteraceae bacterium]|nr:MerR family transcriptional regulator [Paracoccaceae bacterium]